MGKLLLAKFGGGFEKAVETAALKGSSTVLCPHCNHSRNIEPDGYEDIICEGCRKHFRTVGIY